jgi:hypothetical protein
MLFFLSLFHECFLYLFFPRVVEISEKEIESVFGGDDNTQTVAKPFQAKKRDGYGTSAYMLMYRRVNDNNIKMDRELAKTLISPKVYEGRLLVCLSLCLPIFFLFYLF